MTRLRWLTSGESHGPGLVGIVEGLPANLPISAAEMNRDLARRQQGYGRGGRMKIEKDQVEIMGGVRFGRTLGSPVSFVIRNKDFWTERMQVEEGGPDARPIRVPRPGHTDLAGGVKYGHLDDLRNVLERASARETATRVALGAAAKALLREFGIGIGSYVRSIGGVAAVTAEGAAPSLAREDAEALGYLADQTETRALDAASSELLVARILEAQKRRDTLGGVLEIIATGLPIGLGSHVHWDRKLDGRIAQACLGVHAIKAVEVGDGFRAGDIYGSEVHDPIMLQGDRLARTRNHAGGLEGGITNGQPLVVRAVMKPIATISNALPSVNLDDMSALPAHVERSDTCAVPAAGVVLEAMVALTLADALLEALGGDTLQALRLPFARMRLGDRTQTNNVFLVGPPGAGKTSAGPILAQALDLPFIDLDKRIEAKAGAPVAQIFAAQGEEAFRAIEADMLDAAANAPGVVAVGGGGVLTERAWRTMRKAGLVVALDAAPETLAARAMAEGAGVRPLLAEGEPAEKLRALLAVRRRWYDKADVSLSTEGLSVEQSAYAALGLIRAIQSPLVRRAPA